MENPGGWHHLSATALSSHGLRCAGQGTTGGSSQFRMSQDCWRNCIRRGDLTEPLVDLRKSGFMWRVLEEVEKNAVAAQIDAQDRLNNNYGAHAGTIAGVDLSFYPGAQLIRVTNRQPMVGNRYFIRRGDELVALHELDDIQPFCDSHFGLVVHSGTAADYFRFAHFFSDEGRRSWLVEGPQDLGINSASLNPAKRQVLAFIRPLEIEIDGSILMVRACTFEEQPSRLYRDSYRLTPGQPPQLFARENSGIALEPLGIFLNTQLKIKRSDIVPCEVPPDGRAVP